MIERKQLFIKDEKLCMYVLLKIGKICWIQLFTVTYFTCIVTGYGGVQKENKSVIKTLHIKYYSLKDEFFFFFTTQFQNQLK